MLSLNSETCVALVKRASSSSEEARQALAPVGQSLEKLVTISKQALWETRHYMFLLQPLISSDTTLAQLLSSQVQEFEAISGLPAHLAVEGQAEKFNGNQRIVQVSTAIFRITQEALTNAYKHASASQLEVRLRHQPASISVEISDNGQGVVFSDDTSGSGKIYSGRGLRGMRERAIELGGTFEITGNPAGGTRVVASIPI
jgi:signal transduction histidine kinase